MRLGFDHKKRTGGAERETRLRLAHPNRGEFVLEVEIAALVENQEVFALAVMRTADQRNVALAGVDGEIAFAAAGGDDHVHPPEDFLVALDAGAIQREPGGVGADPLPGFHLALIALFRDLGVEGDLGPGMDDAGRKLLLIDVDAPGIERVPVRIQPLAKRGGKTDTGDPDFRRSRLGGIHLSHGSRACCGKPIRLATASMCPRKSRLVKGTWLELLVALDLSLPPTLNP